MPDIISNKKEFNLLPENQKVVVLITDTVYPRMAKIGYGLKFHGWKVILLFKGQSYISDLTKCFDEVYRFVSPSEAVTMAVNFNPIAYHVFSIWNFDVAYLLIQSRTGKVVFDNYDTLTGMIRKEVLDKGILDLERFCIENADGLCCRDIALQYVKKHFNYQVKGKTIFFPDYCWDLQENYHDSGINLKKCNDEIHLAYAGGINVEKIHKNTAFAKQFKNGYFLEFARDLADAKIHFHIYPQPTICRPTDFETVLSEYLKLEAETRFFHIHRPVPHEILIKELSEFDLGLESSWYESHIIGSEASLPVRNYYSMSNKVFDYLDAGLGVILGDDFRMRRCMFEKRRIAIVAHLDIVKQKILSSPAPILRGLRENVHKAKKAYSIRSHAKRLSDFYLSLEEKKVKVRQPAYINKNKEQYKPSDNYDKKTTILKAQKLRLYADKRYLLPNQCHVALLNPFWGNGCEENIDNGRFDNYARSGRNYFDLTTLNDSDLVVLPGVFPRWDMGSQNIAMQLSKAALSADKPVVIFFNTDSDEEINVDNSIIFRTSFNRSSHKSNEFAMPAWSIDFVERYFDSHLSIRHKPLRPAVSFCGLVPPAPHVRHLVLNRLLRSNLIQTNFIIRDKFWGGALGNKENELIVRQEYVNNMINGDYVLCMRGAGNFSYRLYETLSCGRIPVFVDTDCVLPYEEFIDWKRYCVWVDQKDIECIDEIIMDFHSKLSDQDFVELQYKCRKLWEDWLSPQGFFANFYRHFGLMNLHDKHSVSEIPIIKSDKPSCVFINTYYNSFLRSLYEKAPHVLLEPYQKQKDIIQGSFFGDSDFYSEGIKKTGWGAEDLIVNCIPLQETWGRENNFSGQNLNIAVEQIRSAKPQVVYIQDISLATKEFLSAIRPYTELIVGQIASPVPPQADIQGFDMIISSFPHFAERFRKEGITSYYVPLAFDPRVLEKKEVKNNKRIYPVTFVGGISNVHNAGTQLLERIAELTPIEFWGYGSESLPADSTIRQRHHGEVWGLDMFSILSQSAITVNRHIDVSENYANNMRLFEATGCGALLITDYKDNLNQLFEIGKEIVAYRSPEECASLIKYYLSNPKEAENIAEAGQRRTLSGHTYDKRMEKISEILRRHLRYRKEKNTYPAPDLSKISYGHTPIKPSDISVELTSAWKNTKIPERQRALVQQELRGMYKGEVPLPYRVLAEILKPIISPKSSILEIGCSSGYYFEVLEYLLKMEIDYTGADYSESFISMAKDYYPGAKFFVSDGANLFFEDWQFHTVISSCILLHTPNFHDHIYETSRVAKNFVVAHRTPVCRNRPTQYLKKYAYGVETVELIFNEEEILKEFSINRLRLINAFEFYKDPEKDEYIVTYLFKKI